MGLGGFGVLGVGLIFGTQAMVALGHDLAAQWLTPIMWTGYILLCDALLLRWRGISWLTTRRREFPLLILLSVGVWLLFEAYNLHLQNWIYEGVPKSPLVRDFAYFWSFATIMPGIFLTAELVQLGLERVRMPKIAIRNLGPDWLWFALGLAMVTIPLAVPPRYASFLFASVWIGFILLLDPINERFNRHSIRRQIREGSSTITLSLLAAGLLCGFLWEFWNYQALRASGAYWIYTIPAPLRILNLHFGQMPLLGLLGFPPFALELHAFYVFLRELLGGDRVFGKPPQAGMPV